MPVRRKSSGGTRSGTRKRNYLAEYRRRVQRGIVKGLSLSQARGHARAGERPKPANRVPVKRDSKEEVAVRIIKTGVFSLRHTASLLGLSEQHLRRYIKENAGAEWNGKEWIINDQRPRRFPIYSGNQLVGPSLSPYEASRAAYYMQARRKFLWHGDLSILAPFEGQGVTDIHGHFYPFELDPNRLYELDARGELNFPEFYRIIN